MDSKILSTALILAIAVIAWQNFFTIPKIESEVEWINAQADSILALPPDTTFLPGKTITRVVKDTVFVEPEIEVPELISHVDSVKIYRAAFDDGFIRGTISASLQDHSIFDLGFKYRLVNPVITKTKTDTLVQKIYFPQLIETPSTPRKNKAILLAGVSAGGNEDTFSFAPELELISRNRTAYGYRYDLTRKEHWLSVKFPLFGKQ